MPEPTSYQAASQELKGRVAIVTGSARNIGREIARELAAAGAKVVINARTSQAEAEAVAAGINGAGGEAIAVLADVSDEAAVRRMAHAATDRFGRIDIIVNNAAVRKEAPLESLSYADWRETHAIILDGAFHLVKACLTELKRSGVGSVVNIGGVSGHIGTKNRAHVVSAKAGLVGLTRALAHDLAADKVTVNCVVPGLIDTARDPGASLPAHHQVNRTLVGRLGLPSDIAGAVRFLVGPTGRYITGQTLHVNGGVFLT